jgi:predicted dinucleotide-binding enzyme
MTKKIRQRRKPSVSIIGSGRLGQALAIALHSAGYLIQALVAQSVAHAGKAAALINKPEKPILALSPDQLHQLPASDLILITTPDDAIKSTVEALP